MKINWKQKLTSRKFWIAVAGLVVGILLMTGTITEGQADTVSGVIVSLGSIIMYLIAEAATDIAHVDDTQPEPEPAPEPVNKETFVYLSPSDQWPNKYAVGDTNEKEQCEKIAAACAEALEAHGIGAILEPSVAVEERVKRAVDTYRVDLYVPIHTNAFDGKVSGTRMFVRSFKDEPDYEIAQSIFKYLDGTCPGTSSNIKELGDQLYEMRLTKPIPVVYCECDFHDNKTAAEFIIGHTKEIGESIARGICEAYGIDW